MVDLTVGNSNSMWLNKKWLYIGERELIEGWMQKGSICYIIQKHLEHCHFHPVV